LEKKYLKTALNPSEPIKDHKEANMFLAEDRILCLGIFSLEKNNYTLKYVPNAVARTDAVDSNEEFML
jgi:chitin synthase